MSRRITFSLSETSIDRAANEIRKLARELPEKMKKLRRMIGERIRWSAEQGFQTAQLNDIAWGEDPTVNDVTVGITHDDTVTIVFADGNEALFIEFGAGVTHNGAVGSSPHPWGAEMGYLIGTYGKGLGARELWVFKGPEGKVATRGTPAAMPMYRGMQEAIEAIDDMIGEVLK